MSALQALLLDKESGKALFRRGQARRRLNQLEAALTDLRAAARIMPSEHRVQREIAVLEKDDRTQRKAVADMFRGWARASPSQPAEPQQTAAQTSTIALICTALAQLWYAVCGIFSRPWRT